MSASVPHIPRWKTLFNSFRFVRDPLPLLQENVHNYGSTYRLHMGGLFPAIFTQNPGLIRHVLQKNHRNYIKSPVHFDKLAHFLGRGLLTSEGDFWLRQRRLIQPGFHRQRLAQLVPNMVSVIDEHLDGLNDRREAGPIDMYPEMMTLTFNVIARSIFSQSIPQHELDVLSKNITELQEFVIRQIRQPFLNPLFRINGALKRHEQLRDANNAITLSYIEARRNEEPHDDLLQMLLDARYEDTGEAMLPRQVQDEVTILFVAGHDTSANALAWFWYLLGRHPAVEARIREEISSLRGRAPEFSELSDFPYTLAAIEETMRLYPPAWITDRQAVTDDHYDGLDIPKGTYLITYFYGLHHNPTYWSEPEAFRPERFLASAKKEHEPYTYLPFGGGPRMCIGNHFSLMEMQLVVIRMLQRFKLRPVNEEKVVPLPLVTLRPRTPVWREMERAE